MKINDAIVLFVVSVILFYSSLNLLLQLLGIAITLLIVSNPTHFRFILMCLWVKIIGKQSDQEWRNYLKSIEPKQPLR